MTNVSWHSLRFPLFLTSPKNSQVHAGFT